MKLLDSLNFRTKISAVTFAMILLVVVSGVVAIERTILPVVEADLKQEGWRIARGVLAQAQELSGDNNRLRARLEMIFQLRAKLRYIEIVYAEGKPPLFIGDEKYRSGSDVRAIEVSEDSSLYSISFGPGDPVYEMRLRGADDRPIDSVRTGISYASAENLGRHLFRVLFTIAVLILAVSFILTRWFTGMITRPVNRLLHMIDAMARGETEFPAEDSDEKIGIVDGTDYLDLVQLYERSGRDELSRLQVTFRYMAARIRHFQDKLRERYEFEERLLDACPDGIIANDTTGRLILFNKGAQRLLGYTPEEALSGLKVRQIYADGEPLRIKQAMVSDQHGEPGVLLDYMTEIIRRDGTRIPVRLSAARLYKDDMEIGVVGFFHDLTELNQHINALVESNERLNAANSASCWADVALLQAGLVAMRSVPTKSKTVSILGAKRS